MSSEFILYTSEDGETRLDLRLEGHTVWLTQLEIADLFQTTKQNVSLHAKNILEEGELRPEATVKESLTVQTEGNRQVKRTVLLYNLDLILAIGYRVRSPRGTQFRQWATTHLREFLVKGFVMDDERLKNPGGWDYFDELLARIREKRRRLGGVLDGRSKATEARRVRRRAAPSNQIRERRPVFLEQAELRARERKDLTLAYWRENVDRLLAFNDRPVLEHAGRISAERMKEIANERYENFDARRREAEAVAANAEDWKALEDVKEKLKPRGAKG